MSAGPVITRFAPSPTGHLHIGGARSALFCWAFAKRAELEHQARGGKPGAGGRFMIRIEDTDQARSSDESARGILEDLAWLGIERDDGPALRVPRLTEPGAFRTIGEQARDVGSYFQAQRAAVGVYNAYIESLVKAGRAYPAFDTTEELEAMRKACVAEKRTFKYPRPADVKPGVFNEARWSRAGGNAGKAAGGESHVIRFLMDDQPVVVHDQVLGDVKIAPGEVDDFVIRKADGFPTYHFAVVIDDELMGVTHVLRAQEHLANTPRHVAMQRALKRLDTGEPFRTPVYAHMPLIFNMDGTKMSKRDKAKAARKAAKDAMAREKTITAAMLAAATGVAEKALAQFLAADNDSLDIAAQVAAHFKVTLPEIEVYDYRRSGYLPEAITNFLSLLGWNPGMKTEDGKDLEKFDMDFLGRHFSLERIGRTNAKFDRAKLLSFNADYIGKLSDADFASRWRDFLREYEPDALAKLEGPAFPILAAAIKPRARTLRDGINSARFALVADTEFDYDPKAIAKLGSDGAAFDLLAAALERLESLPAPDWSPPTLHTLLDQLAQQRGIPVGNIAQPLRIAVTGTGVSPGIAETLAILGRASTLARIRRLVALRP